MASCLFIFRLWCLILINFLAAFDTVDHSLLETLSSPISRETNTIFSWFSSYLSGLSSSASFAGSSSSADSDLSPVLFSKCPHPRRYLHARYRYFHITISRPDLSLELWIYISSCLFDRPTSPHGWLKCLSVVYILKHSFFPDQY